MKTVLVIGGGITGLSAAFALQKWKKANEADVKLILTEAASELGGKIKSVQANDFIMESGADSIVSRKARELSIFEELDLQDEAVYNSTGRSFIYADGNLHLIPKDSVFGIPASIESLATSSLVSTEGKVAALRDFYLKNESFTKNDSVGSFLEHFLGKELVEKQIAPVLSGVYSGNLDDLSIASTLPYLIDYKENFGSIIKGLEANLDKFQSGDDKKFLSFATGLSRIIHAYKEKLDEVEVLTEYQALKIEKKRARYEVTFANQEKMEADYIVLSVPHTSAQSMFSDQQLVEEFAQFKTSSLISVYLGFNIPDETLPEEGTGFIAQNTSELTCSACTWTSRKWKHTSKSGNLLVRLFYKSSHPAFNSLTKMSEDEILQVALTDINQSLGITTAEPVVNLITNWSDMMPRYQINHQATVKKIEDQLKSHYPGIIIAGCSYYGVGIPDCIVNGMESAKKITSLL